jgi:hypothetical protein
MKQMNVRYSLVALCLAVAGTSAFAQTAEASKAASPTRAQVKMERDEFLRTHRWDEQQETWVLKKGMEAPTGVKSRAEVVAARNEFLKNNKWDDNNGWTPIKTGPRDLGAMSRAEIKAETVQFTKTHQFDEESGTWVLKNAPSQKK